MMLFFWRNNRKTADKFSEDPTKTVIISMITKMDHDNLEGIGRGPLGH